MEEKEDFVVEYEQKTGWDQYLHWAARFIADPAFEQDERNYKIQAVESLRVAVTVLRSRQDWFEPLRQGFQNQRNNLVNWRASQRFLDWAQRSPEACSEALVALWEDADIDGSERVDAFDNFVPVDVSTRPGGLANLAGYLLGALDPVRWPNYRITALEDAYELARFPGPPPRSSPGRHYGHALSFFDATIEEATKRQIPIHDRLDAQGIMWIIAGPGPHGPYGLTSEEWTRFDAFVEMPTVLREERKRKAPTPKKPKRPTMRVCPKCGHDDEVSFVGPAEDQWEFECGGGSQHADPYSFLAKG